MTKSSGALALVSEDRGSDDLSSSLQSPQIRSFSITNTSFQKSNQWINTELWSEWICTMYVQTVQVIGSW